VSHGYAYHLLSPGTGEKWIKPEKSGSMGLKVEDLKEHETETYYRHRLPTHSFEQTDNGFKLRCPFHLGNGQTLNLTLANGGSWNCWACHKNGGTFDFEIQMAKIKGEEINRKEARKRWMTVLRHLGIIDGTKGPPEDVYDYRDETGKLLYQKVRNPGKQFTYRRPDPNDPMKFINKLGAVRRVLYNLKAVLEARVVFLVEGEKDANRVANLHLSDDHGQPVAVTCNPNGSTGWNPSFTHSLKGKHVIIIPDNDDSGEGLVYAKGVLDSLKGHAASAFIRELPSEFKDCSVMLDVNPEHSDFTRWLDTPLVHQVADWKTI
jgi:hypothetical protein